MKSSRKKIDENKNSYNCYSGNNIPAFGQLSSQLSKMRKEFDLE
jgi:hypothetical protein